MHRIIYLLVVFAQTINIKKYVYFRLESHATDHFLIGFDKITETVCVCVRECMCLFPIFIIYSYLYVRLCVESLKI